MLLQHDAPVESVDFESLGGGRSTPAEVKRLFDFLEFRTLADRLGEALGAKAGIEPSTPRDELVAEVTTVDTPAEAASLLAGLAVLDLAAVWEGERGRSPLAGFAVVTDGSQSAATWIPGALLADASVAAALARPHAGEVEHRQTGEQRRRLGRCVDRRDLGEELVARRARFDPGLRAEHLGETVGEGAELEEVEQALDLGRLRRDRQRLEVDALDRRVVPEQHQLEVLAGPLLVGDQVVAELRRLLVGVGEDAVEPAVLRDQLGRGLLPHAGNAGQVVGRVAAQRGVLRVQRGRDPVFSGMPASS